VRANGVVLIDPGAITTFASSRERNSSPLRTSSRIEPFEPLDESVLLRGWLRLCWTSISFRDQMGSARRNVEVVFWGPGQGGSCFMPRKYSPEVRRQVIQLARSGTRVKQLAVTFGVAEVTIYNWLAQDRVDRGEELGKTTEQQLELTAARKRIQQLETELAVSRKINEVFLKEGIAPKGSSR
jgi:transposase